MKSRDPNSVYQRDVSWYACGKGGSASRYHFEGHDLASACGKTRVLDVDNPRDPQRVDPILRCRARGCKERWEEMTGAIGFLPIPASRFTPENHATHLPYPFTYVSNTFVRKLKPGWTVVGCAKNSALAPACQRSESGGPYIGVMFRDPDGFDRWFHVGDYPYQFVKS